MLMLLLTMMMLKRRMNGTCNWRKEKRLTMLKRAMKWKIRSGGQLMVLMSDLLLSLVKQKQKKRRMRPKNMTAIFLVSSQRSLPH